MSAAGPPQDAKAPSGGSAAGAPASVGANILTLERIAQRAREVRALADASGTLPSPCVSVCRMDEASGLCEGCLRTLDEIAAWGMLDNQGKRAVWALIGQRAEAT
jgi:predicted Fe-S protein YdhL (DUF1289 family)